MQTLEQAIEILQQIEQDERNTALARIGRADSIKKAIDILEGKLLDELTNGSLAIKVSEINQKEVEIIDLQNIIAEKDNIIAEKENLLKADVKADFVEK